MDSSWSRTEGACIHCGQVDFTADFGPRLLLVCSCCQDCGAHKECEERAKNVVLTEEIIDDIDWQCSEVGLHLSSAVLRV